MSSNSIFKIYSKKHETNTSDSIFSIIGNSEPDLTKSLAFLLHYSEDFFKKFIKSIFKKVIDLNYESYFVYAEQKSNCSTKRRDISIRINYDNKKSVLIIIEAKALNSEIRTIQDLLNQIDMYCDNELYSDVHDNKLIKATLTKNRIIYSDIDEIISITWEDIIEILKDCNNKKDILLTNYMEKIMSSKDLSTYEVEIFCPPVGSTFSKIEELNIYCCPKDYSNKEAIYLMPRIPVNQNEQLLADKFNMTDRHTGKGFSDGMYKITEIFMADRVSLEAIEDEDLRTKVRAWFGDSSNNDESNESILKVFVLDKKINFDKPKFTQGQNPTGKMYCKLSDLLNDDLIVARN